MTIRLRDFSLCREGCANVRHFNIRVNSNYAKLIPLSNAVREIVRQVEEVEKNKKKIDNGREKVSTVPLALHALLQLVW